jgi:hypothetical protein
MKQSVAQNLANQNGSLLYPVEQLLQQLSWREVNIALTNETKVFHKIWPIRIWVTGI